MAPEAQAHYPNIQHGAIKYGCRGTLFCREITVGTTFLSADSVIPADLSDATQGYHIVTRLNFSSIRVTAPLFSYVQSYFQSLAR